MFTIDVLDAEVKSASLYDVAGRLLWSRHGNIRGQYRIDRRRLPVRGVVFAVVRTDAGDVVKQCIKVE